MAREVVLYKKSIGLDNVSDALRVPFDPKEGVSSLAAAVNVEFERSGVIMRRKGYRKVLSRTGAHSVFGFGKKGLFVAGSSLYLLNSDFTETGLRSGLTQNLRMYYADVADRVYYSNGAQRGYVEGTTSYAWTKGSYVGPTTQREFYDPPNGTHLLVWNGRMYIVAGNLVYYSEPFSYHAFALGDRYLPFKSKIYMLIGVDDGLYVATEDGIYFLSGADGPELRAPSLLAADRIIEHSEVRIDLERVRDFGAGEGYMFAGQKGLYIAGKSGMIRNVTRDNLKYPVATNGSGVLVNDHYLVLMQE